MDLSVRYGPEPDQLADVFLPATTTPAPLVVLLHGGSWRPEVDRGYVEPLARGLARDGFAVANVEYRRPGAGGGWPETFTDTGLAVDTVPGLIEAAAPGRVDPKRLVVLGHSAGGTLALWAAHRPGAPGVVALAPVAGLADAHRRDPEGPVEQLLGGGPDEVPDRYAEVDPTALGTPPGPVVVFHGEVDSALPVRLSREYAAATGAELVLVPGADHLDVVVADGPAWPALVDAITKLSTVEVSTVERS
ncbi:alpha/beta hydrolase [Amycolatopsis rhabdoformis]|uniref:Alpha/beta hydrolase n=1 Tax=Amycolatopsis rhabdoformis TaxID=1448059 RepID=A0ABZ1IFR5_9PSEU|nr:alpha/beta hydrolase [Amycolatopsis rhabdoformis]WSE32777.1 alpha/beta hydrolase [Amycolatopsis rhabdoformis]